MHLEINQGAGGISIMLTQGADEPNNRKRALARDRATFEVSLELTAIHPDLLVLAAILCARPWMQRRTPVTANVAGSTVLAEALRAGPGLRLGSVDPELAPRSQPDGGVPGLCFSGGTDSVAALAVMPDSTRSYHLLRRAPAGDPRPTMFNTRAAEESCEVVRQHGRSVEEVPTDVEYLPAFTGFPHDFTTAVPLLLYADRDKLDAVAWGAPLEATYRLQRGYYRDFTESPFIKEWGGVFAAVGLPVCVPIAGVSELVTSRIVQTHPLGAAAQSCVRGSQLGAPCGRCAKCARKTLLTGAVSGDWPSVASFERQWRGAEPRSHLLADPIKVEPVIAHLAHRLLSDGVDSELMRLVVDKVGPDPLTWLTHSFDPALESLPERYRAEIADRVHAVAPPMSAQDEEAVRAYDVRGQDRASAQRALSDWFVAHPPHETWARIVGRVRREAIARLRRVRHSARRMLPGAGA